MFQRQPVPGAHADGFGALHALDARRQFGRQQAVVGRLNRQLADGRHADDDGRRPNPAFVERDAPSVYRGFGKAGPRLQPIPIEESSGAME